MGQIGKTVKLGNVYCDSTGGGDWGGNVWDTNYIAPTMKSSSAGTQQCVIVSEEIDDDFCSNT